ncbi:MAG: winged helix-turn-helix domain-containing protein [Dehalococcoidia bacterium]|nr:winged helix-turn-helix domain-containing protein [Dehalococcoidia bacterium]
MAGGFGVVLVAAFVGGMDWTLFSVALILLFGGIATHGVSSRKVRAAERLVDDLERRLAAEASASRVMAAVKLLAPDGSPGGSPDGTQSGFQGADSRLAAAARMATGYPASIVFNLRGAHGVLAPSSWSYQGEFSQARDEFEPIGGDTPGAMAVRQGSAIVMSLHDEDSCDLPKWVEAAGFTDGIVAPVTRGLDTTGIVYAFNNFGALPTLREIEQLELVVSFCSHFPGAVPVDGSGGMGVKSAQFRTVDGPAERFASAATGIDMPGFSLNPGLERMELDGISLSLSPTEFLLMHTLASSPGKPVSPVELVSSCWPKDARPADNALDVAIFRLRRKLGRTASGKNLVRTVRGNGYMFVPPPSDTPTPVVAD